MWTEEEAGGMWCPFARSSELYQNADGAGALASINRDHEGNGDARTLCLGSSCMAWRWKPELTVSRPGRTDLGTQMVRRVRGYCGLAGRP